jgi:hypothetical protein
MHVDSAFSPKVNVNVAKKRSTLVVGAIEQSHITSSNTVTPSWWAELVKRESINCRKGALMHILITLGRLISPS